MIPHNVNQKTTADWYPLYCYNKHKPMRIIVFASGGGGNLTAAINLSMQNPLLLEVGLVVTDRLQIPAIDIAHKYNIPIIAKDFEQICGKWAEVKGNPLLVDKYESNSISFHDDILEDIIKFEKISRKKFDFVVLSYRRWIHGKLLEYFQERMINQHPGDLANLTSDDKQSRKYIGINAVKKALDSGDEYTRTSTILVREGHDTGEILCRGPKVKVRNPNTMQYYHEHENIQKRESDWPALSFTLKELALGNFGLSYDKKHIDDCRVVFYRGQPLKYGGIEL